MPTQFICTIGPKTIDKEWLVRLHQGGMNIARVNGAHGSLEDVQDFIHRLKNDLPEGVAILLDLPGNKIRTDGFLEPVELVAGETFVLRPDMLTYRPLYKSVHTGHRISAADGSIQLEVTGIDGEDIQTKVIVGGPLANRKGINIRGIHGEIPFDFERDIDLLNIAIENEIDYIGLSFVRSVEHVRRIRAQLVNTTIQIIAKVETAEAVEHMDAILGDADMIMIDRGDLEAEIGKEFVPLTQKRVLKRAGELGVPVIVASQFLTSMLTKPLPFMAEVSDIANAVLDGASVLMLSEETAIGDYPEECIATMRRVAQCVENHCERSHDAVILAAGPSTGFGSLTTNKHKCMLDVGGTTIVQHQLENLMLSGVPTADVAIVTGHNAHQIEHYLKSEGFRGEFVYNPWFQTTNMATSLWLARRHDRNLILLYGDIVFESSILDDLMAAEGDIVLAVDQRHDLDAEDEKVILEDGLVVRTTKELDSTEATGEFIGMAKLTPKGSALLFDELSKTVREGQMMLFLSDVFDRMAKAGIPIHATMTRGRAWADNDNLTDLSRTREEVYPRIRAARSVASPQETSKS